MLCRTLRASAHVYGKWPGAELQNAHELLSYLKSSVATDTARRWIFCVNGGDGPWFAATGLGARSVVRPAVDVGSKDLGPIEPVPIALSGFPDIDGLIEV